MNSVQNINRTKFANWKFFNNIVAFIFFCKTCFDARNPFWITGPEFPWGPKLEALAVTFPIPTQMDSLKIRNTKFDVMELGSRARWWHQLIKCCEVSFLCKILQSSCRETNWPSRDQLQMYQLKRSSPKKEFRSWMDTVRWAHAVSFWAKKASSNFGWIAKMQTGGKKKTKARST